MAITNPTPKQQRNGADTGAPGTGATMAQPGPDVTKQVASTKRQAEAAGNRRASAPMLDKPAGGASFVWDEGLAINDVEGGGSG